LRTTRGSAIVDSDLQHRVSSIAEAHGLAFVLIFGSASKGLAGPLSDVDVAVYMKVAPSDEGLLRLQANLTAKFIEVFKRNDVDLVIINSAPCRLRYEAVRTGVPVYLEDPKLFAKVFTQIVDEYLDFRPYLSVHYAAARRYFGLM